MHCLSWEKIMLKFFNIFYSHNSQPDIEGLFSCLDIWGVFLDYLTSKVSNARSDKLAEAEATVSRYGQVLKSIYRVGIWASVKQVLWLLSYHYIWYPFDNFLPFNSSKGCWTMEKGIQTKTLMCCQWIQRHFRVWQWHVFLAWWKTISISDIRSTSIK